MKHIKTLSTLAAVLSAGLLLASCGGDKNDKAKDQDQSTQQAASSDYVPNNTGKSTFVKDFDSTQSFINFYTAQNNKTDFDFNNELPLSGRFNALLNELSSLSRQIAELDKETKDPAKQQEALKNSFVQVGAQFQLIINSYKDDLASSDKSVSDNAKKELVALKNSGVDIDLNAAKITDLISQFNDACSAHNNYQVDVGKVLSSVPKAEGVSDADATKMNEDRTKQMQNWTENFKNTCGLVANYVKYVQDKSFDEAAYQAEVKKLLDMRAQKIAEAKAAQDAVAKSFTYTDNTKGSELNIKGCAKSANGDACTSVSIQYVGLDDDWARAELFKHSTPNVILSNRSQSQPAVTAQELAAKAQDVIKGQLTSELLSRSPDDLKKQYPEVLVDKFTKVAEFGDIIVVQEEATLTTPSNSSTNPNIFNLDKTTKQVISLKDLLVDDKKETSDKLLSLIKDAACKADASASADLDCKTPNRFDTFTVSSNYQFVPNGIYTVIGVIKDKQIVKTINVGVALNDLKAIMKPKYVEQLAKLTAQAQKAAPAKK